jgi:hypothetical protein
MSVPKNNEGSAKNEGRKCAFSQCGKVVKPGTGVTITAGKTEKVACNGRHAYQYFVEIYTTGRQFEEGLE